MLSNETMSAEEQPQEARSFTYNVINKGAFGLKYGMDGVTYTMRGASYVLRGVSHAMYRLYLALPLMNM